MLEILVGIDEAADIVDAGDTAEYPCNIKEEYNWYADKPAHEKWDRNLYEDDETHEQCDDDCRDDDSRVF